MASINENNESNVGATGTCLPPPKRGGGLHFPDYRDIWKYPTKSAVYDGTVLGASVVPDVVKDVYGHPGQTETITEMSLAMGLVGPDGRKYVMNTRPCEFNSHPKSNCHKLVSGVLGRPAPIGYDINKLRGMSCQAVISVEPRRDGNGMFAKIEKILPARNNTTRAPRPATPMPVPAPAVTVAAARVSAPAVTVGVAPTTTATDNTMVVDHVPPESDFATPAEVAAGEPDDQMPSEIAKWLDDETNPVMTV